jgi:serine-type D-Ala-D-Ala carboxypeptidase (penicillin-binding protein 5/6)
MGLVALLAVAAVGGAAWLALVDSGRIGGARGSASLATQLPPGAGDTSASAREGSLAQPPTAVRLQGVDAFRARFAKPPRAGLLFELRTGEVLWRRRPLKRLPIASLTKIMTAILVVERAKPRERVKITRASLRYSGSGVGVLPKGKRVRLEALMHGMLLVSGNDAAIALADPIAGSERRFVRLMNRHARALGLACSRFVSSHGLSSRNVSCAADIAALARLAMKSRRIRRIVGKRQAAVKFPIKGGRLFLNNTNPLLRMKYPGTLGLKTGYTIKAGRSYVAIVRRKGRTLGLVLIDSSDPATQAKKLFGKAFGRR